MNGIFAAWLRAGRGTPDEVRGTWARPPAACPAMAAPTPRPMTAVSEIGVSRTGPRSAVRRPREAEHVAAGADVDPGDEHAVVGGQLGFEASWMASIVRNTVGRRSGPRARGGGRGRSTKSNRAPGTGRLGSGGVHGGVELVVTAASSGHDLVVATPAAQPAAWTTSGSSPPPARAPRASGSAQGRPRSARASGRWRPRR